jgi:hypothetical protein
VGGGCAGPLIVVWGHSAALSAVTGPHPMIMAVTVMQPSVSPTAELIVEQENSLSGPE